jgi:hypothetical protein
MARISARVRVLEAAVAGAAGRRALTITTMSPSATLLPVGPSAAAHPVEAITLADAIAAAGFPSVDVLKVDVEGAEEEIFTELGAGVLGSVRAILLECHPPAATRLADQIEPVLRRSGFVVTRRPKPLHALLIGRRQSAEQEGRMGHGLA